MSERWIHLARNGEPLGRVPIEELAELVDSGFLRPEDDYWETGMTDWRPIHLLPQLRVQADATSVWKREAKNAMAEAAGLLARGTAKLAEGARSLAAQGSARSHEATARLLADYTPVVKDLAGKLVETKPFLMANSALENDELMEKAFGAVYDQLPKAVSRFISEEEFITYCLHKRRELIGQPADGNPASPPPPTRRFRLSHMRLLVSDFEQSLEFYRNRLGLGVRFQEEGVYAELDTGAAVLALFHRDFMAEALQVSAPHDQALPLQRPVVVLSVDDVDEVYVSLKDSGVEFLSRPEDRPHWGVRTVHLQDPEGNLIEINSPVGHPR